MLKGTENCWELAQSVYCRRLALSRVKFVVDVWQKSMGMDLVQASWRFELARVWGIMSQYSKKINSSPAEEVTRHIDNLQLLLVGNVEAFLTWMSDLGTADSNDISFPSAKFLYSFACKTLCCLLFISFIQGV